MDMNEHRIFIIIIIIIIIIQGIGHSRPVPTQNLASELYKSKDIL
jgi:hypothetical protein